MQLVLAHISESDLSVLQLVHDSARLRVVGWFECEHVHLKLRELFPAGRKLMQQQEFDKSAVTSMVLFGCGGDLVERESLMRSLARDSVPLALVQPACSSIFAAELDMIQRDTQAPIIPLHPDSFHPAINFLATATNTWEADSPIGQIEQIVIERQTHNRTDDRVKSLLARDALLIRQLIGDFQKVGAMRAGEETSAANVSVHLTGSRPMMTRWSVEPALEAEGLAVSLVGQRGKVTLDLPDNKEWSFSTTAEQSDFLPPQLEFDPADSIANQIEQSLDGNTVPPTWEDAYRAIDLADTASESIRRGKTLPISNARLTEEDTFKSLMAAGGCLIVLVLPLLLLLISLVDGMQLPYNKTVMERVAADSRSVPLPADLNALSGVKLTDVDTGQQTELELVKQSELHQRFGVHEKGTPAIFATNRNEITIAPIPDTPIALAISYEGIFNIWKGWPLILLLPIVFFLLLQLLKLVFPKPPSETQ